MGPVMVTSGEGHGTPEWLAFGRALLIRATRRHSPDGSTTADEQLRRTDGSPADSLEDVDELRTALEKSSTADSGFASIATNAQLDADAIEVFALLAAAEAHVGCQRLVELLQGDGRRARLTLGSVVEIMGPDHLGALTLTRSSPLCRSALVEVIPDGPWSDHMIALHPTVVWALLGDASPDPQLPDDATPHDTDSSEGAFRARPIDVVVANGPDRVRRRHAGALAAATDRFICTSCPDDEAKWAALVREATITGRGLLIELSGALPAVGRKWIERASHLVWVISVESGPALHEMPDRPWVDIHAPGDDPTDEEWADAFGDGVARTHRLTFDQTHRISRALQANGGDLDAAVRRLASGRLDDLTRRIRPSRSWDDIVLSPTKLDLMHGIVDRYRHATQVYDDWGFSPSPSRGLIALFSGPSGTGKTLASEIIAGALGLDLFKLDLSSVVSKYIGETEKNLEMVFDAASAANVVLFFDEADALFGKRSEVKDARDRYANIEVSYLLQRLEAYDGLVVMATNFEKNIDDAFLRRIHTRISFELPGVDERAAIWSQNFPTGAPADDVDIGWLAEHFELSGGTIRNAAIQAAFSAAAAGEDITMKAAVQSVALELRKMGHLLRRADFGDYFDLVDT